MTPTPENYKYAEKAFRSWRRKQMVDAQKRADIEARIKGEPLTQIRQQGAPMWHELTQAERDNLADMEMKVEQYVAADIANKRRNK